jgi:hypothetical protein
VLQKYWTHKNLTSLDSPDREALPLPSDYVAKIRQFVRFALKSLNIDPTTRF